ncbi:putative peroxiredoxin bcp [compost metagenome]|uniref:thioredoxin-dependent peroxiredoxin n=1 Tax=Paenibacillus stellifer TaxID=169760 RepID=A0A089LQE4_9BACL|nr:thioredoxin-dependent thiol peroxidase [Paenibacillus stellifer]AIQ62320.1 peroxiredoxin [Paenibacillus stellifer]
MEELSIGQEAPDFTLPASDGSTVSLSQYRGRKVVLYFYPKNMTPGCTQEACEFRDASDRISSAGAVVLGVSPDSLASHAKFIAKNGLPFLLLSDEDHSVSGLYGVWQLKKLYGKEFMGVVRSTFLIDEQGKIQDMWTKVRVKGHAEAVTESLSRE